MNNNTITYDDSHDHVCEYCDTEFTVLSSSDADLAFCPYCGSELDEDADFEDEEDEDTDEKYE